MKLMQKVRLVLKMANFSVSQFTIRKKVVSPSI